MKISLQAENNRRNSYSYTAGARQEPKRVAFNGLTDAIVPAVEAINQGGLCFAFIIQDFLGMVVPRAFAGLSRNKDITGENNYQEAAEVTIREGLSGPSLFMIPGAILYGIKKFFGKANDVPVEHIKSLGNLFIEFAQDRNLQDMQNPLYVKEKFYQNVFDNALSNAYGDLAPKANIVEKAKDFAKRLIEIEKAPRKSFLKRIRFIPDAKTSDDMMAALLNDFSEIRKMASINPSANFSKVRLTLPRKGLKEVDFKNLTNYMRNFTEDLADVLAKKFKPQALGSELPGEISEFVRNFAKSRSGSRILTNIALFAGIIGFGLQIPKLYQLSDKNPGLNGITPEALLAQEVK